MADSAVGSSSDLIEGQDRADAVEEMVNTAPEFEDVASVKPRNGLFTLLLVGLASIVVVAGGASMKLYLENRTFDAEQARDAHILDTAKQVAVNLVTLRHGSAREDLDRILQGTTGAFRDQFTDVSGSFGQVLEQGQVESTGEVKSAGLVDSDDSTATVIAAVTSTVKNTEAPEGDPRSYRMKVSLDKSGSEWLVSNVEFVP